MLRDYDLYTPSERRLREKLTTHVDGYEVPVHCPKPMKVTRKGPEAPPDTREGEKESCQDNSVDAGVSDYGSVEWMARWLSEPW